MKKKPAFTPDEYYIQYPSIKRYFQNLEVTFDVLVKIGGEYRLRLHTGLGKWVCVGLVANRWFAREWRLDIALNYNYFDNSEVFFQLTTHWHSNHPYLLHPLFEGRGHGFRDHKRYSLEEINDSALLERDLRAVLEEELLTGKAWDF